MAKLKFGCVQGGFAPVRYGKEFFYSGCRDTEIRAPSSPVLHKRFHSCHVVIRAARLERAAMTSAALCNPLPSKCVITDGLTETRGTHSVREFVCTRLSTQEQTEAFVCAVYACMQMSVYCMIACLCVCATVWMCINTQTYSCHARVQADIFVHGTIWGHPHRCPHPQTCAQPKHERQEHGTFTLMHTGSGWERASAPCQGPSTPRPPPPNPNTQRWSGAAADPLRVTFLLCSGSSGGKLEER